MKFLNCNFLLVLLLFLPSAYADDLLDIHQELHAETALYKEVYTFYKDLWASMQQQLQKSEKLRNIGLVDEVQEKKPPFVVYNTSSLIAQVVFNKMTKEVKSIEISTGLLELFNYNKDLLAFVLFHEMTHVFQGWEIYRKQSQKSERGADALAQKMMGLRELSTAAGPFMFDLFESFSTRKSFVEIVADEHDLNHIRKRALEKRKTTKLDFGNRFEHAFSPRIHSPPKLKIGEQTLWDLLKGLPLEGFWQDKQLQRKVANAFTDWPSYDLGQEESHYYDGSLNRIYNFFEWLLENRVKTIVDFRNFINFYYNVRKDFSEEMGFFHPDGLIDDDRFLKEFSRNYWHLQALPIESLTSESMEIKFFVQLLKRFLQINNYFQTLPIAEIDNPQYLASQFAEIILDFYQEIYPFLVKKDQRADSRDELFNSEMTSPITRILYTFVYNLYFEYIAQHPQLINDKTLSTLSISMAQVIPRVNNTVLRSDFYQGSTNFEYLISRYINTLALDLVGKVLNASTQQDLWDFLEKIWLIIAPHICAKECVQLSFDIFLLEDYFYRGLHDYYQIKDERFISTLTFPEDKKSILNNFSQKLNESDIDDTKDFLERWQALNLIFENQFNGIVNNRQSNPLLFSFWIDPQLNTFRLPIIPLPVCELLAQKFPKISCDHSNKDLIRPATEWWETALKKGLYLQKVERFEATLFGEPVEQTARSHREALLHQLEILSTFQSGKAIEPSSAAGNFVDSKIISGGKVVSKVKVYQVTEVFGDNSYNISYPPSVVYWTMNRDYQYALKHPSESLPEYLFDEGDQREQEEEEEEEYDFGKDPIDYAKKHVEEALNAKEENAQQGIEKLETHLFYNALQINSNSRLEGVVFLSDEQIENLIRVIHLDKLTSLVKTVSSVEDMIKLIKEKFYNRKVFYDEDRIDGQELAELFLLLPSSDLSNEILFHKGVERIQQEAIKRFNKDFAFDKLNLNESLNLLMAISDKANTSFSVDKEILKLVSEASVEDLRKILPGQRVKLVRSHILSPAVQINVANAFMGVLSSDKNRAKFLRASLIHKQSYREAWDKYLQDMDLETSPAKPIKRSTYETIIEFENKYGQEQGNKKFSGANFYEHILHSLDAMLYKIPSKYFLEIVWHLSHPQENDLSSEAKSYLRKSLSLTGAKDTRTGAKIMNFKRKLFQFDAIFSYALFSK